jgi:hypothetical protein
MQRVKMLAKLIKAAAVPGDLHFRNGRAEKNARDRHAGSCPPFGFQCFHLLSAIAHNPVATFAQAEPGQSGTVSNSIDA